MGANITDDFIQDFLDFSNQDFSDEVNKEVEKCLIDYLAVTLAGCVEGGGRYRDLLAYNGNPQGNCQIIGTPAKTTPVLAALINGIHGHTVELDDGERYAMMHPGVVVIPAMLSAYTAFDLDYASFRKGVICGYEACIRISATLQPGLKDKGFHATGAVGSIGATLGVLIALNADEAVLKSGLASAATSASGVLRVIKDISKLKPFNAGKAASNALESAFTALSGYTGPYDVLGGKLGFLDMFTDNPKMELLRFQKDERPKILNIYRKPYAACRHAHSAIEAALIINENNDIDLSQIEKIVVDTYYWAVGSHDHVDIEGVNSAKMSTPYGVAAALYYGNANLSEFTLEKIRNEEVLALTKKIEIKEDPAMTAMVPKERGATVSIFIQSGEVRTHTVKLPKGEPECALSTDEIQTKFLQLASYAGYSKEQCEEALELLYLHDINNLLNHISTANESE